MRRKEKEITNIMEIEAIIQEAEVCRLGLAVDNTPYIVPVFFGYENNNRLFCSSGMRLLSVLKICLTTLLHIFEKIFLRPALKHASGNFSSICFVKAVLTTKKG